jgi:hypothetical protein
MNPEKWFLFFVFLFASQHLEIVEGVPFTVLTFIALPLILLAIGRAKVDAELLRVFLFVALASLLSCVVNGGVSSYASVALLLLVTAPLTLVIVKTHRSRQSSGAQFLDGFRAFMIFCVALGGVQVLLGETFVSVRDLMPEDWLLGGFNTSNQMEFDSGFVYRSNGFFFLEPSFFSQYVALVLLLEMRNSRNLVVMSIMAVGLALSLSGTGFVLLAVGALAMALRTAKIKNFMLTLVPLILLVAAVVYFLPSLAARLSELNDEDTSGYWRFVLPFVYIYQSYSESITLALFGVGPGVAKLSIDTLLMAYSSGFGKMFYEYGILTTLPLIWLYYRFCKKSYGEAWFTLAVLVLVLIINCGVQQPVILATVFLLVMQASPRLRAQRLPASKGSVIRWRILSPKKSFKMGGRPQVFRDGAKSDKALQVKFADRPGFLGSPD